MTELCEVTAARQQLIESICDYSTSQVDTWRRVPLLALQADGRDGGMGHYHSAYTSGMWKLYIPEDRLRHVYVNCGTGGLNFFCHGDTTYQPLREYRIVLLANHLEHLNAERVVASLKEWIDKPLPSWISQEQAAERESQRVEIQRRLNLGEIYERTTTSQVAA